MWWNKKQINSHDQPDLRSEDHYFIKPSDAVASQSWCAQNYVLGLFKIFIIQQHFPPSKKTYTVKYV